MELKEVMQRYGGHTERLLDSQIESGKEVDLVELTKALDQWRDAREKVDDRTFVDHRRYGERRQSQQALSYHAQALKRMTFGLDVLEGHSKEFVRGHLEHENPGKDELNVIKELFRPDGWYLLIAYVKDRDGNDHLDFCHANTREVFRLNISAESPIIKYYKVTNPVEPRGNVIIF